MTWTDILYVEAQEIEEETDAAQLHEWYFSMQEVADDVVAQIEANRVSESRDFDWLRRANGTLIGLKKNMKRIDRKCRALGVPVPDTNAAKQQEAIRVLQEQVKTARAHERKMIADWLREFFGEKELADAIVNRDHIIWARANA